MSQLNARVSALVERELKKDRNLQTSDLQAKAVRIDKSVEELSGRQFHARYALQARRKLFGRAGSTRRVRTRSESKELDVRDLLTDSYQQKRAALEMAVNQAFERAIKTDSIGRVNKLLSALDRHTKELKKV